MFTDRKKAQRCQSTNSAAEHYNTSVTLKNRKTQNDVYTESTSGKRRWSHVENKICLHLSAACAAVHQKLEGILFSRIVTLQT